MLLPRSITSFTPEDIVSGEENVAPICRENHCNKDINEGNANSYIISSIINLKNKKKGACIDDALKYISDIHLVDICKKRYNANVDKLLQKELIWQRTYAKEETLNIVNKMQQLLEPEAGLANKTENLQDDIHHIRSAFMELKAFTMSEVIDIKN